MDSQRNRAVSDVYEPGSVFKIVSVAGALEERLITPNSVYDCGATSVPYRGRMVSLPADSHAIGAADIRQIVRESSNRGTVQVGMQYAERFGEDRFFSLIKSFGFGAPTGLITGAEVPGPAHPAEALGRAHHLARADGPLGQRHRDADALGDVGRRRRRPADAAAARPPRRGSRRPRPPCLDYAPRSRGRAITPATAAQTGHAPARGLRQGRHRPDRRYPGLRGRGQDGHDAEDRQRDAIPPPTTSPRSRASSPSATRSWPSP